MLCLEKYPPKNFVLILVDDAALQDLDVYGGEAQAELTNKIQAIVAGAIRPWVIGFVVFLLGFFLAMA